jgi:exopolysaccharide biosynthesis WecB/TagA/CpsF family protein
MGSPAQEIWIDRNFDRLAVPVTWAVGALVDFVSGRLPRAPRFMLDHGLEWLYRLAKEPRRLSARYLIGNPLFFYRILKERVQR